MAPSWNPTPGLFKPMLISELQQKLITRHQEFTDRILAIPDAQLHQRDPGKWNAIQLMDHIRISVKPVRLALQLPKFVLRVFGTANRSSRSYEALVERYQTKLREGGKAPGRFVPSAQSASPDRIARELIGLVKSISQSLESFTEAELDTYLLPHPLLGKLTLREMMYFTIYHVGHHEQQLKPIA
ncbi:MAG TPA: DinB family protein [Cyclobacteriaceae bacterium]|nr:DinB family protein [Cyclobacteriaceae bacterium]